MLWISGSLPRFPMSRRDAPPPRAPLSAAPRAEAGVAAPGRLGETGRFVATFLLIAVLAGLFLSIAVGSSSGSSALGRVLHGRLFAPWMTPLWLDPGHDTRLTYGLPEDGDHFLEIVPAPSQAGRAVRVPAEGDRSGRAARWRRLARAAALAEEEGLDRAGILSTSIGAGLLGRVAGDDVIVRFRRRLPSDPALGDNEPRLETVHEGRVRRVDGEIQWIPLPPAEEVAPLVPRTGGTGR